MTITATQLLVAAMLVLLGIVFPWLSHRDISALRRVPPEESSRARLRWYNETIVLEWAASAVLLAWWLLLGRSLDDIRLAFAPAGWQWIAIATSLAAVWALVAYFRRAERTPDVLAQTFEQLGRLAVLIPRSRTEMRRFAWVSVTAGICEEILYRGLLMTGLAEMIGLGPALILSSVVFGIGHSYQGVAGVVKTGAAGLVMALVVLLTGSLPTAMLIHAALDLVQGRLLWKAAQATVAAPAQAFESA